ncbi:BTB/POZ domain-containing protein 3-like [Dendronephthya gigantea]|uniref:BTB/POZ domain-containing protein 3-like n=1 Tax=Dendronephthya gigantea TaxID=151771 RepID=UPI00106B0FFF|nr:BTB/POZ domain-containing protein 3-like [Dendronephthya gigantea]
MSNVSFVCGKEGGREIYAHKYILGTRSVVFEKMLYGELAEKESQPICIPDADEDCFEEFLRFLYEDDCVITGQNATGLLYLADKYEIPALSEQCWKFLEENIDQNNVFEVLTLAQSFKRDNLKEKCRDFFSGKTTECLNSEGFRDIKSQMLEDLLKGTSFLDTSHAKDIELFKAAVKWSDSKCAEQGLDVKKDKSARRQVLGDIVYDIRFLAMTLDHIIDYVSFTGVLTNEELVGILQRVRGHEVPGLKWKSPVVESVEPESITITRFDAHAGSDVVEDSWFYVKDDKINALTFTVNESIHLQGVRLFGDCHGSSYSVKFKVKEMQYEKRRYPPSKLHEDGVWGYDVMLPQPISLQPDEEVTMTATIEGPESFKGSNGKLTVNVGDIVVRFHDTPSGSNHNHTSKTEGQFYKIFLLKM